MTITEPTATDSEAVPEEHQTSVAAHAASDPFGSGDHKVVGRLYLGFSLLFGVGALVVCALSSLSQVTGSTLLPADTVFQLFVLGRFMLVFLVAVPFLVGLATAIVPLQVGAATVAFPRAAAGAFWAWLVGSGMLIVSVALNGGPGGGNEAMVDLSLLSMGMVIAALLLGVICAATTAITLRTTGMDLFRAPFFSWSVVVAAGVWCLTFPVFLGNLLLVFLDHKYGAGTTFAAPDGQWGQLTWMFSQPQAFAVAIPALGIAADAVVTLGGARQPNRGVVLGAIGAFGFFSLGAWAQPAFNPDLYDQALFVGFSVLIGLPVLVLLGGLGMALRKGSPRFASPLAGGLLAVLVLLLAAGISALFGIEALQLHEITAETPEALARISAVVSQSTAAVPPYPVVQVGLLGIVVLATLGAATAGTVYWAPKLTGRKLPDGAGTLCVLLLALGAVLYGIPYVLLGFANKSPGLADAADALTTVSAIGAGLGALALVVLGLTLLATLRAAPAADDAWERGQTLEWATASPPVRGNFGELAPVLSPEPLLDERGEEEAS